MIFVTADEIPLITVWNRLPDDEATVVLMIEVVATIPFVPSVITLPVDDIVFEVITEVVATIPFTFEVKVLVAVVKTLVVVESNPTIEVVDITPLTFVVTTPPA
jgi:hypothetical protein